MKTLHRTLHLDWIREVLYIGVLVGRRSLILTLLVQLGCSERGARPDRLLEPSAITGAQVQADKESPKSDLESAHPTSQPLPSGLLTDTQLHTLFAPDDPTTTLEVQLIERVTQARLADPDEHQRYHIRYAVYNMTSALITRKLIAAERAGVDVQVLIESEQLNQEKAWNLLNERFITAGLSVEYDHRYLNDSERQDVDLIGIESSGLMHLKMRIFETPSWSRVLTGSLNPNTTSHLNEETLHLISDPTLISRYQLAYQHLLYDRSHVNTWDEGSALNVLFTPAEEGLRAVTQIFKWIEEEEEQILLMMFALRDLSAPGVDASLVELLARKVERGVPVYIITDRKQSDGVNSEGARVYEDDHTEDRLREVGVHVYEALNDATPYTAIHHKVAILGVKNIRVISGASNWSRSGLGGRERRARNVESVLFIDSGHLDQNHTGRRFLGQWLQVLKRYGAYSVDHDHELEVDEVFQALSQTSGWPQQSFSFEVSAEVTRSNEQIAIVGDHDELGLWGLSGHHPLETSTEELTTWRSSQTLSASIGRDLTWKQVIIDEQRAIKRWEYGSRYIMSLKPPLMRDRELIFSGVWR